MILVKLTSLTPNEDLKILLKKCKQDDETLPIKIEEQIDSAWAEDKLAAQDFLVNPKFKNLN